jgi:Tetratricopeptide repeat
VLGEEHADTRASMANLAMNYRKQGQWTEAEGLVVRTVDSRKNLVGFKG